MKRIISTALITLTLALTTLSVGGAATADPAPIPLCNSSSDPKVQEPCWPVECDPFVRPYFNRAAALELESAQRLVRISDLERKVERQQARIERLRERLAAH